MAQDKKNKSSIKENCYKFLHFLKDCVNYVAVKISSVDMKESNLRRRMISSFIMIPVAIYAIYFSKNLFLYLSIAIAILMSYEWLTITKKVIDQNKWKVIGFFYISVPIYAVIRLRFIDSDILFWMFAIIWVTDIFAFFVGKAYGGAKLAPSISPGKTWSGFYGGILGSALVGFFTSFMFVGGAVFFVSVSILLSVVEQLGDLLESKFKRTFGVKDSGNIIPGHGGVLDRLDGMMLVAPLLLVLVELFSSQFGL